MADPNLWTIVKSISTTKDGFFDESLYVNFLVAKAFGHFSDTVLIAQEVNERPLLSKEQHHDFLFNTVRPKKRFSKWPKKLENDTVQLVQNYFNYSERKAIDALRILTEEDLKIIREKSNRGGINTE